MDHVVVKPKTPKARRLLERRAPKDVENTKSAMFIHGKTSDQVAKVMKDLYSLKKPHAVMFHKKNAELRPFEDSASIEFFSKKSDCSLLVFGSHNKKRPHNLVFGRLYDHQVLDMIETGVETFRPLSFFKGLKCAVGSKPCLIFSGDLFETDANYSCLKNLLIDFFHQTNLSKISLASLDHVICATAIEGKVYFRTYMVKLKKSSVRTPRVELEEMGPSLDLVMRRSRIASAELFKETRKQPKTQKPFKVKNVSVDPFGTRLGRVHMKKQDLGKLQVKKSKALKRAHSATKRRLGPPKKKVKS